MQSNLTFYLRYFYFALFYLSYAIQLQYYGLFCQQNVGAPPPRSPPKINLSIDDPNDNLYNKKTEPRDPRKNATEDVTSFVAEKAKKGTKGVVETAFNAGAAVAEGMEKSWGGIKETTEKIKDSVVGSDEDEDENNEKRYGGNKRGDQGYVDKHIDDLRRKAGGYDRSSH